MARHALKKPAPSYQAPVISMKTRSLLEGTKYCYRHRLEDPALLASVRKYGILTPLIVTGGKQAAVIAGHRRFRAAKALKIKEVPVFAAGALKPQDAFLLCLVSNWKQSCSEPDRARALALAERTFHFSEKELVDVFLPLLGLPQEKGSLGFFRELDRSPDALKDLVEDGRLAARGLPYFLRLAKTDQDFFAAKIASRAAFTSSQLLQTGEWLSDILKGSGKTLRELCAQCRIFREWGMPGMDPRARADRFFAWVKQLRFPGYTRYLEDFQEQRALILRDAKELRLEPVQGFEEPGFELHARIKTPGDLDRLLRKVAEKRSALNSLFEIAL